MTKDQQSLQQELESILQKFAIATHEVEPGQDETSNFETATKALLSLIAKREVASRIEQMELLRWKYKELNDQSISYEFLEAYNTLMEELSAQLSDTEGSKS